MTTTPSAPGQAHTIDPTRASAIACLVVDAHEVLATLSLGHLMQVVPDPRQFEDRRVRPALLANPAMAELADKRETVQRYFTGAKRTNVPKYAEFIFERVRDQAHRGTPPICLGTPSRLTVVEGPEGTAKIGIPYGRLFLAVDGETQRAAWEEAHHKYAALVRAGMADEEALESVRVPVEIHHNLPVERLQALFYERNVLGAKVNANEAISKDQRDPATQITRKVMDMPIMQPNGQMVPTSSIVQQQSRQVAKNSPHWVTLSALRTMVVTTILGRSGLQIGAKPVEMPDNVDFDELRTEVAEIVHAVLQRYADKFANKEVTLIGAPAILAGLGVAANRVVTSLPASPDRKPLSLDDLLALLDDIRWEKDAGFWDGVATRKTPKGVTTVAGPKEVGYAVAEAIDGSNPISSAKIRGRQAPVIAEPQQQQQTMVSSSA